MSETSGKTFCGYRLKKFREMKYPSTGASSPIQQLSYDASVTYAYIRKLEKNEGKLQPQQETLGRVCEVLGIRIPDLYHDSEHHPNDSECTSDIQSKAATARSDFKDHFSSRHNRLSKSSIHRDTLLIEVIEVLLQRNAEELQKIHDMLVSSTVT